MVSPLIPLPHLEDDGVKQQPFKLLIKELKKYPHYRMTYLYAEFWSLS